LGATRQRFEVWRCPLSITHIFARRLDTATDGALGSGDFPVADRTNARSAIFWAPLRDAGRQEIVSGVETFKELVFVSIAAW